MRWEEFYEKSSEWAASTTVSRMSQLESFGAPAEIIEVIVDIAFYDEKGATRLLRKATDARVKFTGEQLAELCLICDEQELNRAIRFSADCFTAADMEALEGCCDEDILLEAARKGRLLCPADIPEEAEEYDEMSSGELEETCDYALECLAKAHAHVLTAYNLSVADVGSEKRALSVAKYACMAEATLALAQAQLALEDLRPWIPDGIALDTAGLNPGKSAMRRDVWIDGDLSDLIIQKKIKKTLKSLESASRKIQAFRSRLREKGGYAI